MSDNEKDPNDNIWGKPKNTQNGPNSNNPWGNDDKSNKPSNSPWGNDDNSQQSANLDDLARRIEDKLKGVLGGSRNSNGPTGSNNNGNIEFNKRTASLAAIVIGSFWLLSGVYVVDAGEEALITRFGKYVRQTEQGLQYRLPSPIENHLIVNVQRVNSLTVGSISNNSNEASQSLMLTGDENIVNVSFQVLWQVRDASKFQFNLAHGARNDQSADTTVNAVAEAAMREVVGRSQLEFILTTGRAQIESQAKDLMQRILNSYGSGIMITQVNLRKAEPPQSVVASFREVAAASQEAETRINQARSYRNSVVPQAQGEAARFNQLYQEYKLAPEVTRQRIYLETMEKIYERANKVIIENNNNGNGPMMVLPPDLLKNATAPRANNSNGANQ